MKSPRSVNNKLFSKTNHRILINLGVNLWCLKGKTVTEPELFRKSHIMW